jgi:DNA-binding NtrC family response regulator
VKQRKNRPRQQGLARGHGAALPPPWPGNVRELENAIYRSAVIAQGDAILVKDLPAEVRGVVEAGKPPSLESLFDQLYEQLKVAHPHDMLSAVKAALDTRASASSKPPFEANTNKPVPKKK